MERTDQHDKDADASSKDQKDDEENDDRKPPAVEDSLLVVAEAAAAEDAPPPPSSVHGEAGDPVDEPWHSSSSVPQKPELSLKEKLVMRERQRRIETERARWKRQFLLSSGHMAPALDDTRMEPDILQGVPGREEESLGEDGGYISVEEQTLGEESMRAHPDEDEAPTERLGFNMERFLRNSETFNPQLEPMDENEEKSVLMERFLKDTTPPLAATTEEVAPMIGGGSANRSVSFDRDTSGGNHAATPAQVSVLATTQAEEDVADISLQVESPPRQDASLHVEPPSSVASSSEVANVTDGPRVLRLTEADMLEMASIDEASIGNAPPSDRDEVMSEIGELAEFAANRNEQIGRGGSHDTPTTAVESSSQMSGGDHVQPSFGLSIASSTDLNVEPSPSKLPGHLQHPFDTIATDADVSTDRIIPLGSMLSSKEPDFPSVLGLQPTESSDAQYTNRPKRQLSVSPELPGSPTNAHSSTNVDGFDYDKNAPASPGSRDLLLNNDYHGDLPANSWFADDQMYVSPLHTRGERVVANSSERTQHLPTPPFYGSINERIDDVESTPLLDSNHRGNEDMAEAMRRNLTEQGKFFADLY